MLCFSCISVYVDS